MLNELFSYFIVEHNPEVQYFIRHNAINFAKQHQSVTYLVIDNKTFEFAGYFTLAMKPITIPAITLSNSQARYCQRMCRKDNTTNTYHLSAYLIAQLGKNYALPANEQIDGSALLDMALDTIKALQRNLGGTIQFLECVDHPKLIAFYEVKHKFKQFGMRRSDNHTLLQYLKII